MLTEIQLHNKRAVKMLHRKTLLKTRQAQVARISRHGYAKPKFITLVPASTPSVLGKLASMVKGLLRRSR